jgi:biopolymer transport protein TolQ
MGGSESFLSMAFHSGPVVGGVLLLLLLSSVGCWAVILYKLNLIRRAVKQNRQFLDIFWDSRDFRNILSHTEKLTRSPLAAVFREGYAEWRRSRAEGGSEKSARRGRDLSADGGLVENVDRALKRTVESETAAMERLLVFLATVASAAPFVGLFGTVWGIMESFRDIGITGTANLAVVAPGISEALIATATGLAAAIPAVVAYNYLVNAIQRMGTEMDGFSSEFLNIVTRQGGAGEDSP